MDLRTIGDPFVQIGTTYYTCHSQFLQAVSKQAVGLDGAIGGSCKQSISQAFYLSAYFKHLFVFPLPSKRGRIWPAA